MISKELLSAVLENKTVDFVDVTGNQIWFHSPLQTMCHKWSDMCINIHELAHKCKEWITQHRLMIISHFGSTRSFIEVRDIDTNKIIHSLHGVEPEAVFQACEWVLSEKT